MALTLPQDAMINMFEAMPSNNLPNTPNFNICPTNQIHTVTSVGNQRYLRSMRWGFIPHWYTKALGGPLLINARSETIADKPAFRLACRERRCLIIASGFFEWKREEGQTPQPWWVTRADEAPMVFGGIWQDWSNDDDRLTTCAIVTTDANAAMAPIHHRLPVILTPDQWGMWLGEEGKGAAKLMKSAPEDALSFRRVGTKVNSNRSSGPELIEPIDAS